MASSLNANVTFLGYQSGKALHDTIKNAKAVVLPSEWYENAPLSVMEAYALGKPVIGANIGGIPELIKEGETGLPFESANVVSLSNALNEFINMKDDAVIAMGKTGRKWVQNEFSLKNYSSLCKVL